MSPRRSDSLLDRLVGACFVLLAGAGAVYLAIRLLQAVWLPLVLIIGAGLVLAALAGLIRYRRNGW